MKKLILIILSLISFSAFSQSNKLDRKLKVRTHLELTEYSHCGNNNTDSGSVCYAKTFTSAVDGKKNCKFRVLGKGNEHLYHSDPPYEFKLVTKTKTGMIIEGKPFANFKIICNFQGTMNQVEELLEDYFYNPDKAVTTPDTAIYSKKSAKEYEHQSRDEKSKGQEINLD